MRTLTSILALVISLTVFGQNKTFNLTDSTFEIGATYTIPNLIYNLCLRYGDTFEEDNKPTLDSLTDFLMKNENLIFEIGSHTDQRGSTEANLILSEKRAEKLKMLLIENGIKMDQLITKGYGENQPINEQADIDNLETFEEKENAYRLNRRIELRIVEIIKN